MIARLRPVTAPGGLADKPAPPTRQAPRKGASPSAKALLALSGPAQPQSIEYMDGTSFNAQKWNWHRYVLADHLLGPTEKVVASYLAQTTNELDGGTFRSQETIADETGIGLRTVERALAALERRGWICKEQLRGRRNNLNILTYDPRLLEPIDVLLEDLAIERKQVRARKARFLTRHP